MSTCVKAFQSILFSVRIPVFILIILSYLVTCMLCQLLDTFRSNNICCRSLPRLLQIYCRVICFLCAIKIHHNGLDTKVMPSRFLLVANHVSYLDIIVLGALFPLTFVAKEEIRSWALIGKLLSYAPLVFVNRAAVTSRVKAIQTMYRNISQKNYCVFPEGSTTDNSVPSRILWQSGQLWALKNPVRPHLVCVGIHYKNQKQVAWIGDMKLLPHLFRTLIRPSIHVYLESKIRLPTAVALGNIRRFSQTVYQDVQSLAYNASAEALWQESAVNGDFHHQFHNLS